MELVCQLKPITRSFDKQLIYIKRKYEIYVQSKHKTCFLISEYTCTGVGVKHCVAEMFWMCLERK